MRLAHLIFPLLVQFCFGATVFAEKHPPGIKRCHTALFGLDHALSLQQQRREIFRRYCGRTHGFKPAKHSELDSAAVCGVLRDAGTSLADFLTYAMFFAPPDKIRQWSQCIGRHANKNPLGITLSANFTGNPKAPFFMFLSTKKPAGKTVFKLFRLNTVNLFCESRYPHPLPVDVPVGQADPTAGYECRWFDTANRRALVVTEIIERQARRLFGLIPWFPYHKKHHLAFAVNDDRLAGRQSGDYVKLLVREYIPVRAASRRLCGRAAGFSRGRDCSLKEQQRGLAGEWCYVTEVRLERNLNPDSRAYWKLLGEPELYCSARKPCSESESMKPYRWILGKVTADPGHRGIRAVVVSNTRNVRFRLCSWGEFIRKKPRMKVAKVYPLEYGRDIAFKVYNGAHAELHGRMNGVSFRIKKLGRSHPYLRRLYRSTSSSGQVVYVYRPVKKQPD